MNPQGQFKLVRWHRIEVIRTIKIGTAIRIGSTGTFQQFVSHTARYMFRCSEHHVLEQVREAGQARLFIGGADVVPDIDSGQW